MGDETPVMEIEQPAEVAISTAVEAPPPAKPSFNERSAKWTPEQRDHWKLTGEEPEIDAKAAPSAANEPETPSKEGVVETEPEPGPGKTKEQKSSRQSWAELREAKARAEAERDLLKQQLAESRKSPPAAKEESAAEASAVDDLPEFPDIEKYETIKEFNADVKKWQKQYADALRSDMKRELAADRQQQTAREAERTWTQQVEAEKAKYPDFEEVAFSDKVPASDAMIAVVKRLPNGAAVSYALGKNLAEAARIAELTHIENFDQIAKTNPNRAAYLLGKAEARAELELGRLVAEKTPAAKPSAHPPKKDPPRPSGELAVQGSGKPPETMDNAELLAKKMITFEEYKRRENQKDIEMAKAGG